MQVKLTVNGEPRSDDVEPRLLLVHYLREKLGLRAANVGCDTTSCGACTVLLDGQSVKSCTVLTAQAQGRASRPPRAGTAASMSAVQDAFRQEHGLQCGFCTPGMVMAATSLLAENPRPTETQVREGLEGNFCRCTGYHNIVRAVLAASAADAPDGRARGRRLRVALIPASFDYVAADSAAEAVGLLAEHGEDAKLLAGGHSLLPMMKLRLAMPEVLIDIGRVEELRGITADGSDLVIGAATRHAELAASALVAELAPLLAYAAGQVGDPQIRHRGTIGGSLAHADPAADLPMALVALGGSVVAARAGRQPDGRRRRLLHRVLRDRAGARRAAHPGPGARRARAARGATRSSPAGPTTGPSWASPRPAAGSPWPTWAPVPVRARAAEAALAGGASPAQAAETAAEGTSPGEDIHADRAYREHLARVLTRRALEGQAS